MHTTVSPDVEQQIWARLIAREGEEFRTATGLRFTYQIERNAYISFFRDGRKINRVCTRANFLRALSRCPLTATTDIHDLMCYAYLYGLLKDRRITGDRS